MGRAPGSPAAEGLGKEARLGQNGLLKPTHHHGRPLAQVVKQQPFQVPRWPETQAGSGLGGSSVKNVSPMLGDLEIMGSDTSWTPLQTWA